MVEEQITEGSLSESWWPGQWSWQRRASGGTLHNRQQEPQPGGARDQPPETLSSHSISSWFSMFNFNCLISTALEIKWNLRLSTKAVHFYFSFPSFSSDGISSFTYLWFCSDTVLGCSRRVMSGFLRQPFFKIISHNENKNTFPPELSIFASEARRHGGRVKIIYHTPAPHSAHFVRWIMAQLVPGPPFKCGFYVRYEGLKIIFGSFRSPRSHSVCPSVTKLYQGLSIFISLPRVL